MIRSPWGSSVVLTIVIEINELNRNGNDITTHSSELWDLMNTLAISPSVRRKCCVFVSSRHLMLFW